MGRLYLVTCWHANLQYSSIPFAEFSEVIERCYWPTLELLDDLPIRLGLEFPGYTLREIARIDPEFITALRRLAASGKCEVVGSGHSQNIFPLIPAEVNAANLAAGNDDYLKILGFQPVTAFVNEQTYSDGLPRLYAEAGYRNLVMEWEAAAAHHDYPEQWGYGPQFVRGTGDARLNIVWNSMVWSERFKAYLRGELSLDEYARLLLAEQIDSDPANGDKALMLYGNDWELINYNPAAGYKRHDHFARLRNLVEELMRHEEVCFATPSEVVSRIPPRHEMTPGSAEYPLLCWNPDEYNVVRWAVSGRDDVKLNTESYRLYKMFKRWQAIRNWVVKEGAGGGRAFSPDDEVDAAETKGVGATDAEILRQLNLAWSSDYRTRTTDEKLQDCRRQIGALDARLRQELDKWRRKLLISEAGAHFAIFNPHAEAWAGGPFEVNLRFQPGELRFGTAPDRGSAVPGSLRVLLDGAPVDWQPEKAEYYRDGSLRYLRALLDARIPPGRVVNGRVQIAQKTTVPGLLAEPVAGGQAAVSRLSLAEGTAREIATPAVGLRFSTDMAGGVESLAFNLRVGEGEEVAPFREAMWKAAGPGSFGFVFREASGRAETDAEARTSEIPVEAAGSELAMGAAGLGMPIRMPVSFRQEFSFGVLEKTYYAYTRLPRLDVAYHFNLNLVEADIFRIAGPVVDAGAFRRKSLTLYTVNGGYDLERYGLSGKRVCQDEAVNQMVTAPHCFGATEGWVAIDDGEKGLLIVTDLSETYSVPLIRYEENGDGYLLKIWHSLGESDITGRTTWRGHSTVRFSIIGYQAPEDGLHRAIQMARHISAGMLVG
ncbi:MAG: hypothetical protein M1379_13495 [Firmicutes bacterium]|nr:hypothetical protein [Bacillota bacterium]